MGKSLKLDDKPLYGYWYLVFAAFFSPKAALDIVKRWRGFGIIYFLFAFNVALLPFSVQNFMHFKNYVYKEVIYPLENTPVMHIKNGDLQGDFISPYNLYDGYGDVVGIIDTKSNLVFIDKDDAGINLVFNKNILYFRMPDFAILNQKILKNPIASFPFGGIEYLTIDLKSWISKYHVKFLVMLFLVSMIPGWPLIIFCAFFFILFSLALMVQTFTKVKYRVKLSFKAAARLTAFCAVAPSCVLFILITFFQNVPAKGVIFVLLFSIYYSLAMFKIAKSYKSLVHA
jgi:Protein of unknown function (DUF1189)